MCFGKAYTVELEAELNQLKEENLHLKQALVSKPKTTVCITKVLMLVTSSS